MKDEKKKVMLSISIEGVNFEKMERQNINKSKFVNVLLSEYYKKENAK